MSLPGAIQGSILKLRSAPLQTKIGLVLFVVVFPISIIMAFVQSQVLHPILAEEVKQVGLSFAQNLAAHIEANRLLGRPDATRKIEEQMQRMIYAQPSIIRVDVISKDSRTGKLVYLASNIEGQEAIDPPYAALRQKTHIEDGEEEGIAVYDIFYPVRSGNETANIKVMTSRRFMDAMNAVTLRINLLGALLSTIALIFSIRFFLKRLLENEKQLKVAQASNQQLSEKLQLIQQELIHNEKLAVMGQLTASFAHEIGTPLNAIGGHLQMLSMDLKKPEAAGVAIQDRMTILGEQLKKIENIVKQFLQTTKRPIAQQKEKVPLQAVAAKVVQLVLPSLQRNQISFGEGYQAKSDQVLAVPIEMEQVVLNLMNNAIDSMREKSQLSSTQNSHALWVRTYNAKEKGRVVLEIQDSGQGIQAEHLKQIFKPFFTTKPMGEGHGLGLSICQQIIKSYGGEITVQSVWSKGTTVRIEMPTEI
jgi:signal transduction histidine kinase